MPFRFIAPQFVATPAGAAGCQRRSACGPSSSQQSNPLFDLLSAFETEFAGPRPATGQCKAPKVTKKTIVPHFDILETSTAYILEGELPGVANKASLDIQFHDSQTLIVKGEVARHNYDETTIVPKPVAAEDSSAPAEKSRNPTVEESVDESQHDEFEVVDAPASPSTLKATTEAEAEDPAEVAPESSSTTTKVTKPKYWVNERSVGVFERSFSFQGLVDQEGVSATLADGLLTITVPKREAYVRRVQIQ